MLNLIYYIIDVSVILYGLYFIITGIFAFKKPKKIGYYNPKNRFAIFIAARNEEKVIGKLLDSLKKQDYPDSLYDIYVIPNNCTDRTAEVSAFHGANIVECKDIKVKAKSEALRYAFDYVFKHNDTYDAVCIFDADNVVQSEFLRRMNDALCEGYNVAQGFRDSKNPSDSWISSCYSLYYWTQNYFFNQSRMNIGWSSSINGTGFMVSTKVLKSNGFNTITMTEDIEFAAQCACNNERIAFVNDAITYDEQPTKFMQSWKQRKRWSTGTLQCLKTYFKPLIKNATKYDIPQCLDMLLFFMAPIMQIIAFLIFIAIIVFNSFGIKFYDLFQLSYTYTWISLIITYLLSVVISCVVIALENKKVTKSYMGILTLIIFMFSWIPINIICMFTKNHTWEPIIHDKVVDIENIVS